MPWLTRLASALGLAALEGASVAFALWAVEAHRMMPAYARENRLDHAPRVAELWHLAGGVAATAAVVIAVLAWKRREALVVLERGARRLSPLALLGPAALLLDWRLWPGRETTFYALVLAVGACVPVALVASARAGRSVELAGVRSLARTASREIARRVPRWLDAPLASVLLGAAFYGAYFSVATGTAGRRSIWPSRTT
jgi:hypothetical protein